MTTLATWRATRAAAPVPGMARDAAPPGVARAGERAGGRPSRPGPRQVLDRLLGPVALAAALVLASGPPPAPAQAAAAGASDPEALALLRAAERRLRPGASRAVYQVLIVRPAWQRMLRFRSDDDRDRDRSRLEVLDPAKIRGTVFFKVGRTLSMYLPRLKRTIAISPVMMQDEWMGSDFNHQDLIDAGALIDDYTHRVVAREREAEVEVLSIESVPRADTPVVWHRLLQHVRGDGIPVEVEFFDAQGVVRRRLTFHDVRELGGWRIPTRLVMEPLDKPGQRTEVVLEALDLDVALPDSLFEPPAPAGPP